MSGYLAKHIRVCFFAKEARLADVDILTVVMIVHVHAGEWRALLFSTSTSMYVSFLFYAALIFPTSPRVSWVCLLHLVRLHHATETMYFRSLVQRWAKAQDLSTCVYMVLARSEK